MQRLLRHPGSSARERLGALFSRVPLPRAARSSLAKLAIFSLLVYISYIASLSLLPVTRLTALRQHVEAGRPPSADVSPEMAAFWGDLLTALTAAKPDQTQVTPNHTMERAHFDPTHPDHLLNVDIIFNISDSQFGSLETNHKTFVAAMEGLVPRLPFERGTRGVVTTASPGLLGITITSILMLRQSGSTLPVEVFLSNATEHGRTICNKAVGGLGARCLSIEDFLRTPAASANLEAPPLERFQFKAFALLFSSFQSVLFLDADAFPVRNPDYLMQAEPFASHGLVTFPDFWVPTVSPIFWRIASGAGGQPSPVTNSSRATESGIMLFDKMIHSDTLLLATYYNLYGPRVYYWLHSQGAWGTGDKETFRLSAEVLGKPVWHVRVGPDFMSPDSVHDGSGIMQYDPEQDWARYKMGSDWEGVNWPKPSEAKDGKEEGEGGKDSKVPAKKDEANTPRWIFLHTNRVKIDSWRLLKTLEFAKDEDGNWTRLWGADSGPLTDAAGYDIEKAMWQELIRADCSQSYLEECVHVQDFYQTIFAN